MRLPRYPKQATVRDCGYDAWAKMNKTAQPKDVDLLPEHLKR